jgi:hypothetical protein
MVSFGAPENIGVEDPLWGSVPSHEEQLFAATELESAELLEAAERGGLLHRPADPPDMIERLGDLIALLGPRYRTLPREELWRRAVVGRTTPLQRLEKRLGKEGAVSLCDLHRVRSGNHKPAVDRDVSPESLDYDPDGKARAAWLTARVKENDAKTRAATLTRSRSSPITAGPALAPSMHLSVTAF